MLPIDVIAYWELTKIPLTTPIIFNNLCWICGGFHTTTTEFRDYNQTRFTTSNIRTVSIIFINLLIIHLDLTHFLPWNITIITTQTKNSTEQFSVFGSQHIHSQLHTLLGDIQTIITTMNSTNNNNNTKPDSTTDIEMKDKSSNTKTNKNDNFTAPEAEDTFPTPKKKQQHKQIIQPCGERPQNEITLHLSAVIDAETCNITETEVQIANALVALDRDFQILPFSNKDLNPLTPHQKISPNKEVLDEYFHKPTIKHHQKLSTLHIVFQVKARDTIMQWRQNSHFQKWLKTNKIWIRQTVITESRVTNIGWFQNLHPDSTNLQIVHDIFQTLLQERGYNFQFEMEKANVFQPRDNNQPNVSTRALKLVTATKDIAVATEAFFTLFEAGFNESYKHNLLKKVNFIPYGRHINISREHRVQAIITHNKFLQNTALFFINNLRDITGWIKYMDKKSKEQKGTFQAYMIKVLEVINLAPANGANCWVVTCDRELLEDTEQEFDLFMEDITTYMGDAAVGNVIGIKKGNKWELRTRELSRIKFQDSNINYLKKIGMYLDKVTEKSPYPMNNKQSKNTQFVYTPKTNNKAWSKHLFPENKTTPKKQPPQTTQIPSQTANMNPTLAPPMMTHQALLNHQHGRQNLRTINK